MYRILSDFTTGVVMRISLARTLLYNGEFKMGAANIEIPLTGLANSEIDGGDGDGVNGQNNAFVKIGALNKTFDEIAVVNNVFVKVGGVNKVIFAEAVIVGKFNAVHVVPLSMEY